MSEEQSNYSKDKKPQPDFKVIPNESVVFNYHLFVFK